VVDKSLLFIKSMAVEVLVAEIFIFATSVVGIIYGIINAVAVSGVYSGQKSGHARDRGRCFQELNEY
jgi:hypothetical protein